MTNKEKNRIQKEIVDSLATKPHGRLLLHPRIGKTKLMIDVIKRDKPEKILWVTPSARLASHDIIEEFSKWGAKRFITKLTTSTYSSLNKITGHYNFIILDEEQALTLNNAQNLLNKSLSYDNICSMTGTETKHIEKKEIYNTLGLKVLCNLSINKAVDIGLLANYSIKVIQVEMSTIKDIDAGNRNVQFKTSEYNQYQWYSKMIAEAVFHKDKKFRIFARMRAIKNSKSKLNAAKRILLNLKGKILIFAGSIKQAEEVCKYSYHSKTDDLALKAFQQGDINRISMVNSGSVGFTYENINHLVILQSDSDKNGQSTQKLCRSLQKQKNYKATLWIFCLMGTQDEKWIESTLLNFDKNKIEYLKYNNIKF